jgi:hypothetical protein
LSLLLSLPNIEEKKDPKGFLGIAIERGSKKNKTYINSSEVQIHLETLVRRAYKRQVDTQKQ